MRRWDIDFFFHLTASDLGHAACRLRRYWLCPWERATCDLTNPAFTDEDKAREFLEAFRAGIEAVTETKPEERKARARIPPYYPRSTEMEYAEK